MNIQIDKKSFLVLQTECKEIKHPTFTRLKLYSNLNEIDQLLGLVQDIKNTFFINSKQYIDMDYYTRYYMGGYIAFKCSQWFNIQKCSPHALSISIHNDPLINHDSIFYIVKTPFKSDDIQWFTWSEQYHIGVSYKWLPIFKQKYKIYITDNIFNFDNLLHLTMIVKNAGETFRGVLESIVPHIDRWTILDTGSTDGTIDIINQVLVPKVRGELYREDFVDFGTTRNRCLELAGDSCKFIIMLDDTYSISGDLKKFLKEIRSDQYADSFSLYVKSSDIMYVSNRIIKTNRNLRYKFKIHEVIQEENNINVVIPTDIVSIIDIRSDYMEKRTMDRKPSDLTLLLKCIEEEPLETRYLYYTAQTYIQLNNYTDAYLYFLKRILHPNEGFVYEKFDACFEAARISQFKLFKPWNETKYLYNLAIQLESNRPEPYYFMGAHYYLEKNMQKAFKYLKKAFEIGFPKYSQFNLRPEISYSYVPKLLAKICYQQNDFKLGQKACELYIQHNSVTYEIEQWSNIFTKLNMLSEVSSTKTPGKPIICFVADGNWSKWNAETIRTDGLGGSETYILEIAREFASDETYEVHVFCNCSGKGIFDRVRYHDITDYVHFIQIYKVYACYISRFTEYLPVTYKTTTQNVYLILHDIATSGTIIITNPKLKAIYTMSNWHKSQINQIFPTLNKFVRVLYAGIRQEDFSPKTPNMVKRFIYSSFANRGLLQLLKMWGDIRNIIPDAQLNIFSDITHPWCIKNYPDEMIQIQKLILKHSDNGIVLNGWCTKTFLNKAWNNADIWLYPCVFKETFCITALEAAISKTLVITNDLAALKETVGFRGIVIPGDVRSIDWKLQVLDILQKIQHNLPENLIQTNYVWASQLSWKKQVGILRQDLQYDAVIWDPVIDCIIRDKIQICKPTILLIGSEYVKQIDEAVNKEGIFTLLLLSTQSYTEEQERVTIYRSEPIQQLVEFIRQYISFNIVFIDERSVPNSFFLNILHLANILVQQNGILFIYNISQQTVKVDTNNFKIIYKDQNLYVYQRIKLI